MLMRLTQALLGTADNLAHIFPALFLLKVWGREPFQSYDLTASPTLGICPAEVSLTYRGKVASRNPEISTHLSKI
jgi:hypothetical protein